MGFILASTVTYIKIISSHQTVCYSVQYEVTIQTSDINFAGSDSSFYYTFIGTKGSTSEHLANANGNDMESGQSNTWTFSDSANIGRFDCIKIRMDGSDGWHFEKVLLSIY